MVRDVKVTLFVEAFDVPNAATLVEQAMQAKGFTSIIPDRQCPELEMPKFRIVAAEEIAAE